MRSIIKAIILTLVTISCLNAEKYGLVIAVGDYPSEGLWPDISSANDIPHVTSAFQVLGFSSDNITILTDKNATKEGILNAFHELAAKVGIGDIVFIHYSGHGQQIVDDDGDELDGLDEAIVPHDSPLFFEEGVYEGENLIRDDLIGELTLEIRRKIGVNGQVILVMDSCHSGSGTRGAAKARGTDRIMAPDNYKPKSRGSDSAMGIIVNDENAAPMASFFGASSKELNYETVDDQANTVGSLTYAIASTLATMSSSYSFGELFDRVKLRMKHLAPNQNPQWEGPEDVYLLGGGSANKDLMFPVKEMITSTECIIGVGTMAEVFTGSVIELFSLDKEKVIATGEVVEAYLTESDVALDEPVQIDENELIKVKVVERMQPPVKCYLNNTITTESGWHPIVTGLVESSNVELTIDNADLYLSETDGKIQLVDGHDVILFEKPYLESRAKHAQYKMESIIRSYTQGKYLRAFSSESHMLDMKLEIREVDCSDPSKELKVLGEADLKVGSCIKLHITNNGKTPAYFSVIDIQPDNYINLVIPATGLGYTSDEYYLEPGESFETNYTIEVAEPLGNEVMKLIATDKPLDLSGIIDSQGMASRGSAPSHPFEQIMSATFQGSQSRGAKVKKPSVDQVGTYDTYFKIVK